MAFIAVYFFVFGAGTFYLFRMMGKAPVGGDAEQKDGPLRSSGITPLQQLNPAE
jgi:cytochrome d ubiquinol oxidase subunit I